MRAVLVLFGVLIVLGGAALAGVNATTLGRIYLPSGTGITAKQLCSLTFVSGLEPDRARALYLDPLLGEAGHLMQVDLDLEAETVTASVFGVLYRQRAVHRDGLGCTLVHDPNRFDAELAAPPARAHQRMALDGDHRARWFDEDALQAAIDGAFDPTDIDRRNTLAVAVLHQGRLVAEAYADGVDADTPLHGWSMTKSLAATMAGVMVQRELIDLTSAGQIDALAEAGRPGISIDDLLRMTGGLAGFERNDGSDPNSEMLFTQADMARYAATRDQIHDPGAHWDYQSGNTVLAGSALEQHMGETVLEEIAALRAWLFEPLNIYSAVLEADQAGTLQWSSYMYASAQDWARLGQLYLDNGRVGDEQIIPPNWLSYVATPTATSDDQYGSSFWLNEPHLPADAVSMRGFQSQWAMVVPSEELVVVRLGATNGVSSRAREFAAAVIAAKREAPPQPAAERTAPDLDEDAPGEG